MVASVPPSSQGPLLHTPCLELLPGFVSPTSVPSLPTPSALDQAFKWCLCPLATA